MHASPTRYRVAILIALAGVALSGYTWSVDRRLAAGSGYTSFCNLGGVVNCDAVIGSRYSRLLVGVPDELLGMGAFAAGALLAVPGAFGAPGGGVLDLALLGLAGGSVGFAAVLFVIATFALGKACLLCLSLDVAAVAWLVVLAPLARNFAPPRTVLPRATVAAGFALAAAAGTAGALRGPAGAMTVADVIANDPKFYDLYSKLPVRPVDEVAGGYTHAKGNPDAPITIVEFSDFQCPACGQAFKDLRTLSHSRRDIRIVFRNFPLDGSCNSAMRGRSPHPDACLAAMAADCAARQGRFWEYHDLLFENQHTLDRDSLFRYAREVGLDIAAFRTCIDDPATREHVRSDVEAGIRLGVTSTPTLFINGRTVDGALEQPYYDYAFIIEKHVRDGQPHGGS